MDREIFDNWLKRWNRFLEKKYRKILVFVDNFSGHHFDTILSNINFSLFSSKHYFKNTATRSRKNQIGGMDGQEETGIPRNPSFTFTVNQTLPKLLLSVHLQIISKCYILVFLLISLVFLCWTIHTIVFSLTNLKNLILSTTSCYNCCREHPLLCL